MYVSLGDQCNVAMAIHSATREERRTGGLTRVADAVNCLTGLALAKGAPLRYNQEPKRVEYRGFLHQTCHL